MGLPARGMAPRGKSALVECSQRNQASGRLWDHPGSPPSQAAIPSTLNGLLHSLDEALIALGATRGGLQEVTTVVLEFNAAGEP
jgi:hypothetical protein